MTIKFTKVFSLYYSNRFGWFRLFGYGLKFKDVTKHGLLFSERREYKKGINIGNWRISFLTKNNS